jgi:transcription elongation factor Elf1
MEKRKEYAEDDIMTCPKCDSDNVDYEEAPDRAKCLTCGLKFTIRQVAVWEE